MEVPKELRASFELELRLMKKILSKKEVNH